MFSREDFRNVFGHGAFSVVRRVGKVLSVVKGMIIGDDVASTKLPLKLQLEVTDKCNFDCVMCDRTTRGHIDYALKNDVKDEQVAKLIEVIKPYYVTLNGLGEPLLNKDIGAILRRCRAAGIRTAMPCNLSVGKVLNTKVAENPPSVITFSIHGATKRVFEAISVKSNFEKCMASLTDFVAKSKSIPTEIHVLCVLQRLNLMEFREMFRLLKGLDLLDGFVLVPVFDKDRARTDRLSPTAQERAQALAKLDLELSGTADEREIRFLKNWRRVVECLAPGDAAAPPAATKPCFVPWFETYVSAKGDVMPCSYLTSYPYMMGNVNDMPFEAIWNGEQYRRFRAHLRDSRATLPGCDFCPRDDSSRLEGYGLWWKRRSLWKRD